MRSRELLTVLAQEQFFALIFLKEIARFHNRVDLYLFSVLNSVKPPEKHHDTSNKYI